MCKSCNVFIISPSYFTPRSMDRFLSFISHLKTGTTKINSKSNDCGWKNENKTISRMGICNWQAAMCVYTNVCVFSICQRKWALFPTRNVIQFELNCSRYEGKILQFDVVSWAIHIKENSRVSAQTRQTKSTGIIDRSNNLFCGEWRAIDTVMRCHWV